MDISYLTIAPIILVWIGFFFKTQLPFYWSTRTSVVFLKQFSFYLIIVAWIMYVIEIWVFNTTPSIEIMALLIVPTISAIFFRFFLFYGNYSSNLVPFKQIESEIDKATEKDSEVVLINFQNENHVYPITYLRINDVIHNSKNRTTPDYSLTYCVLCNTIHAYILPVINGKQIEITSNNGTILNGNKILADTYGKYVWQQFTGQGLNKKTKEHVLVELKLIRGSWLSIKADYQNLLVYKGKKPFISKLFFQQLQKLMKNIDLFSFSKGKTDKRLKRKALVVGIELGKTSKAYPLEIFHKDKTTLIHDQIGGEDIVIIHNKEVTNIFQEKQLTLVNEYVTKDEKKWDLRGRAIGNHENLKELRFIDKAYWYMWSKFHPNTEIYEKLEIKL